MTSAKRGEIWLVNLDPTRGQEIQKTRPIVIISSDLFEPITNQNPKCYPIDRTNLRMVVFKT